MTVKRGSGVSRSGFYAWLTTSRRYILRPASDRQVVRRARQYCRVLDTDLGAGILFGACQRRAAQRATAYYDRQVFELICHLALRYFNRGSVYRTNLTAPDADTHPTL